MSELNIQININGEDISSLIDKLKQYENEIDNLKSKLKNCEQNICELTNKLNNNTKKNELIINNRCRARVFNQGKDKRCLSQCNNNSINGKYYCSIHIKKTDLCPKKFGGCNGKKKHKHGDWEHFGNIDQNIIDICPEYKIGYKLLVYLKNLKDDKGINLEIEDEILNNGDKNPNIQNIDEQYRQVPDEYKKKKYNINL